MQVPYFKFKIIVRSRRESRSEDEWEEKTKDNLDKYRKKRSPSPQPLR
jgi:hypothetical protein